MSVGDLWDEIESNTVCTKGYRSARRTDAVAKQVEDSANHARAICLRYPVGTDAKLIMHGRNERVL